MLLLFKLSKYLKLLQIIYHFEHQIGAGFAVKVTMKLLLLLSIIISHSIISQATEQNIRVSVTGSEKLCQSCPFELIAEKHSHLLPKSQYLELPGVSMSVLAPIHDFGIMRSSEALTNSFRKHIKSSISIPENLKALSPELLAVYGYENIEIEPKLKKAILQLIDNSNVTYTYFVQYDAHEAFTSVENFKKHNSKSIYGLSYFDNKLPSIALNVHQNFFTGSSTLLHELFHLHDPYLKKVNYETTSLNHLIAEFRAYKFESLAYPYLKKHFSKNRKYLSDSIGKRFESLTGDKDILEEVLERIYPIKKSKLPRHLEFEVMQSSGKIFVNDHFKSLQKTNKQYVFNMDRNAILLLPNDDSIKIKELIEKLEFPKNDAASKSGSNLNALVNYLENQIIRKNKIKRNEIRKSLNLTNTSSIEVLLKSIKKYILDNKLDDVLSDLELLESSFNDWPKGVNGGD